MWCPSWQMAYRAPALSLSREAGVSPAVIRGMAGAGLLVPTILPAAPPFARLDPAYPGPAFCHPPRPNPPRHSAGRCPTPAFSVTVLDGVTGSGKTEVYLEAVAECLAAGRQALVLLPEIALSSQWLERFHAQVRRGPGGLALRPTLAHPADHLAGGGGGGSASVVVGARSALFLPFIDLGLIVVDEEHETAFKQEEGVVYHARDMAVVRARLSGAAAVLVSATPSLETLANVDAGRYRHQTLERRHGGATLPAVATLDLRDHQPPRGRFLAEPLVAAINDTIARGEQAMLFLNRRRLRAADAVPPLRAPHAVPELHGLAGGASCPQATGLPPLRPYRADPACSARSAPRPTAWCPSGPAWSGSRRRRRRCSPRPASS